MPSNKTCLLITTFNRGHLLRKSLERLTYLTLPDEILIVDDGSKDSTISVFEEFKSKLPLKYIYNNSPSWTICSFARNIGIKNTDAEIIITAEPELLFVTDIVKQMLKRQKEYPNDVISVGTIYHAQPNFKFHPGLIKDAKGALKELIVETYEVQPKPYRMDSLVKVEGWVATFSALYLKEWLFEIGGWDEEFPGIHNFDDHDLLTRLRIKGHGQYIDLEMEGLHQYHTKLPLDKMGETMKLNEDYFVGKKLDEKSPNDPALIANKNRKWGIIK